MYDLAGAATNGKKNGENHAPHSVPSSASDSPQIRRNALNSIAAATAHGGSVAFCGELYKLSSRKVLASWKSRFFVLDTEHHQMRYYDTAQDEVPRGCIDLQDVRAVRLLKNTTSVPRRFQDSCTFEVSLMCKFRKKELIRIISRRVFKDNLMLVSRVIKLISLCLICSPINHKT